MSTRTSSPFLRRRERPGRRHAHTGVVHAPGRAQPARVPGGPGRGLDPRRHRPARPRRRDHAAAGAPLRRRRRRRCTATSSCRPTPSASASTSRPAPARSPPSRCAAEPTSTACARSSPTTSPTSPRPSRTVAAELGPTVPVLAFAGAPFTVASYLVEGRPSRTYEHTKALVHTDEVLWHDVMERLAAMAVTFIDVQLTPGRPGLPAVRLVGRRAGARPTTSASCCRTRGGSSPSWPPATRTCPASTSASAATTCSSRCGRPARGDRPRLADADRRRPPAPRRRRRRPGQPRPGARAGRRRRRPGRRPRRARRQRRAPGHVFNLGHGVHPATDPGVLAAIVDLVHEATDGEAAMTTGRRADGVRHAAPPGGDRGLLHRHPPGPPAVAGAARRPRAPVRGDRRALAAGRRHRGPADRPAGGARQRRPGSSSSSASG